TGTAVGCSGTDPDIGDCLGGVILRTTDGGATWTEQLNISLDFDGFSLDPQLFGVSFTDANTGTVVGSNGTILRTTDGGITWRAQSSGTTYNLLGVSFTDADNGTVVGWGYKHIPGLTFPNGTILRTTDGGTTWTEQSKGTTNSLYGVSFTDANNGTV